jgi:hypothetical protein
LHLIQEPFFTILGKPSQSLMLSQVVNGLLISLPIKHSQDHHFDAAIKVLPGDNRTYAFPEKSMRCRIMQVSAHRIID